MGDVLRASALCHGEGRIQEPQGDCSKKSAGEGLKGVKALGMKQEDLHCVGMRRERVR